ncbi:MAG: hypothetical protein PHC54_05520 [Candidatus Omnitrophica bacterium]|nr:hypothetical protein [Candidatus Omnitrophota bacterium]MDD5592640.1 hypothetical protein [Candidatus Omnitrophota bacterium]
MSEELNKTKIAVGVTAIIATLITIFLWIAKLKWKKKIAFWVAIVLTIISIGLWIWYVNLPSFQDTNKSFEQIEESFDSITKGDLE